MHGISYARCSGLPAIQSSDCGLCVCLCVCMHLCARTHARVCVSVIQFKFYVQIER